MTSEKKFQQFLLWREKHINQQTFIFILCLIIGVSTALAAYVLKGAIETIQELVTSLVSHDKVNYWYLAFPVVGITIASLFVKYIVRDNISHGITKILFAISQHKAIIKVHNIWSSLVASAFTIGFGGSVGAESPIVLTGSAIGSNLGQFFRLDQKTVMLLVGCGATGAISAIFKAPITGVMFTLEVLLLDLTMASIVPIMITSVTATASAYLLMGPEAMFKFESYEPFQMSRIPQLILLGIVCGLVAVYFTRVSLWFEAKFKKIESMPIKIFSGGVILSLLILLFPPLYGEGYTTISQLLAGNTDGLFHQTFLYNYQHSSWVVLLYLVAIVLFKVFATTATNGSGGTGGLFAPTLFMGCLTGYAVSILLNMFGFVSPNQNLAFAGMAGLMASVMHAPLTGTFLIAELTGGYDLFMDLLITSVIAYVTILLFEKHSLYAQRLAEKGELLTHHKDRNVLTLLHTDSVIEKDLLVVHPEMTLGELVKVIGQSSRNLFPVTDLETGKLLGMITLDEVRNIMFRSELYDRFTVQKLMISPKARINIHQPMGEVMNIMESTGAWNLPVIDNDGVYLGCVSKSRIFNSYRKVLVNFSEE